MHATNKPQTNDTQTDTTQAKPSQAKTNQMTYKPNEKMGNCSTVQRYNDLMIEN